MFLVDTALQAREVEGRPIRVTPIGADFMTQGVGKYPPQIRIGAIIT